jgi:hypothetical protein
MSLHFVLLSPSYIIKLPTPTAKSPVKATITHCALPLASAPFIPALFVGLVLAAEDVEEPVLAAFAGPILPP